MNIALLKQCLLQSLQAVRSAHPPVDEVAKVVEQLRVVLEGHVGPGEGRVLALRAHVQQVEAPHVRGDARVLGHVSEHAHAAALGELGVLVVQVLWGEER